jgi:hypothetical protein
VPAFARLPLLVFSALALLAVATPAGAAGLRRDAPAAPARPEGPSTAWTSAEGAPACVQSRRKLWQPGEGWTVRRVTTCR